MMDSVPMPLLFLASVLLVLVSVDAGYRLGRWRHRIAVEEKESAASPLGGATLALLGFVLAFTFSLASSRFDDRRRAVVDDANAIGTAWLRTDFLPAAERERSRDLYRRYVALRIGGESQPDVATVVRDSEQIQVSLWTIAADALNAQPTSQGLGRYVESLNAMIDMHSVRVLVAVNSRIPPAIWIGLYLLTACAMGAIGYSAGLTGTARTPAVLPLALAFSLVLWLIADLDRPQSGLLRVDQSALQALRDSMGPAAKG